MKKKGRKGMNRDDASKFQVGDRVYAPFHGYGIVIKVYEQGVNACIEDGYLSTWTKTDNTRISIAREPPKEKKE